MCAGPEVTPPVTVGGVAYPFGRIYTGSGMQSAIRSDFLWWQVVQAPFTLYTGWLYVEHVDEVVTFVPDLVAGGGAFKVLIADPTLGTSILQAEANPATTFIGKPGYEMTVAFALERYGTPNTTAYADEMASIKATLMLQLGLDENAFIHIPAFFEFPIPGAPLDPEYSESRSLLPNLVNVLVVNGRLIVAEPFYDGFEVDFLSRLNAIGYQDETSVRFIDNWVIYHQNVGEVHCGTHVKRNPSHVDWWKQSVE